jgi:DNA-binding NtrC family response regulator
MQLSKVLLTGLSPSLQQIVREALRTRAVEVPEIKDATVALCAAGDLANLRSIDPELPAIVMSEKTNVSEWLDALEAGAADYCGAPFEPDHLARLLSSNQRSLAFSAA